MIVLLVDNLFFYLGGQSVSCKASLAALRLYGYFCDIVVNVMMLLSENKYDDDVEYCRQILYKSVIRFSRFSIFTKRCQKVQLPAALLACFLCALPVFYVNVQHFFL